MLLLRGVEGNLKSVAGTGVRLGGAPWFAADGAGVTGRRRVLNVKIKAPFFRGFCRCAVVV